MSFPIAPAIFSQSLVKQSADYKKPLKKAIMDSKLVPLLVQLGSTPDEVASTIEKHGIQGVCNAVRFLNPIVRYLQSQVHLDAFSLDLMQPGMVSLTFADGTREEAALPEPIRLFLDAFNRGEFPKLQLPMKH